MGSRAQRPDRWPRTSKPCPQGELELRQTAAEHALIQAGITFNVYSDSQGVEKTLPFDLIPRIVGGTEWKRIERGLKQRITALNLFIDDIYHDQKILKDGVVPREIIASSKGFRQQCVGWNPPRGIWCHITGTDLVRHRDGQIYVLEDNLRCPSGRLLRAGEPPVDEEAVPRGVRGGPGSAGVQLSAQAPRHAGVPRAGWTWQSPRVVLLTPGMYNSAYFEHSFLAQQMGVELVEGSDLVVHDGYVWMRTTQGFERVDVIYRRIDDDFLDPEAFRPDSMLGVPGLMEAYQAGNVALANAPGTGVADDKVVYAYVPRIIKYYLGEDAILPNVPTYICSEEADLAYVLEHMAELVVKAANESGGYGMLVGPHSTKEQRSKISQRRSAPTRATTSPSPRCRFRACRPSATDGLEGRHVDLRPYILYGKEIFVLPGGLTRVALRKGLAGGQLLARRRQQGHLGAGGRCQRGRGRREPENDLAPMSGGELHEPG